MFVRLLGKFVCGEMIAFAVCGGGGVVGVGGKIVQLCNSINIPRLPDRPSRR